MLETSPLETGIIFHLGPVHITRPVVTTWFIMAVLAVGSWLSTRRLCVRARGWQTVLEIVVQTLHSQMREVMRRDPAPFLPMIGTLFIFLIFANLSVLLPGVKPPTARIETPMALAIIVFFSVHGFGIRMRGIGKYLKSYTEPHILLLPLNVASEFTRTFSLMIRLFGNIMSHELIIGIVVVLAGFLVPVPLMVLSILIGIVQAYIFTVLATVYIGAGVGGIGKG